ncbi:MAG: RcnB family protein [Sphingorhabdus sp.]
MKKTILIAAAAIATLSPIVAHAQTRELERDRREVREESREYRDAQRYGDRDDVREERGEYRDAKREYREDWRDYRQSNRDAFRATRFSAPFRYRSFNNGVGIGRSYYAPRYYINNYDSYRLRSPGRNLRYVRHYNDVLLVNVRTGRVVEVYRNFFW